jgi:tripartite-type tricarboxylate transporter receptor subunit TctC
MLVGYGVGTGNDLYMRLLARHIGKHIPGRPTIEPENMPGAGSMVMMNCLYNVAPHGGPVAYLARFQSTRATPAPADRLELVYLSSSPVIAKIRF